MEHTDFLIIGNGAAGVTAAETIRQQNTTARIIVVGAEPYPMYSRPGLAYVLMNEISQKQVIARQPEWYEDMQIELIHGQAVRLDVENRRVTLHNNQAIAFDKLLIATGARATPAPYPGNDLKGVVYLDTLDGTKDLIRRARRGRKAVVIGGGITALELTEGLAQRGVETHYFVRRDRLWSRVFHNNEARILEEKMHHHGVHIHYNTEITEILGNWRGKVRGVRLKNDDVFKCNLVGIGIGVKPQLSLVKDTPVACDRAILVNEYMQTNVPYIYAAGDCAQVYDRWTQQHMLDILWPSAVAEGHAAALNMTGHNVPYVKGSPFNACLLFGLHIATIGQINPRRDSPESSEPEVIQHLSRGSSEVWFTFPKQYHSAWSQVGTNTIRLAISGNRLVGALVMGDQNLADPLRFIIENDVDISNMNDDLRAGGQLMRRRLQDFWQNLGAQKANGNHPVTLNDQKL